jgi:hypothetical protein
VTGLGTSGSSIYGAGVDTATWQEVIESYTLSGTISSSPYLFAELGITFHDIAYQTGSDSAGDIWYAVDDASYPVRVYNSSGTQVGWLPSTVIPYACGLCFDTAGYLWASDNVNHKIYKIDVDMTGVGEEGSAAIPDVAILLESNPAFGSVVVTLQGFSGATRLSVYDAAGRCVFEEEGTNQSSVLWNGRTGAGAQVPTGTYFLVASDESGNTASNRLVLLR